MDRIIVGTHNHLYVINNSVFYDITPLRKTSANLTNPLVTTNSSSVVTVTDTSHGAETGDFIVIKQATAVGGISADTLNRLEGYQITKVMLIHTHLSQAARQVLEQLVVALQ